jgi:hypothetical protein
MRTIRRSTSRRASSLENVRISSISSKSISASDFGSAAVAATHASPENARSATSRPDLRPRASLCARIDGMQQLLSLRTIMRCARETGQAPARPDDRRALGW